jgi:predicted membrane-bound dolichyl-phosphate-mannose-protein mannosyltransferase
VVDLSLLMGPHSLNPSDPVNLLAAAQPISDYPRVAIIGSDAALLANQGPVLKVVQPAGYMPLYSAGYMQLVTGTVSPSVIVGIAADDDPAIGLLGYDVVYAQAAGRVTVLVPPLPEVWVARCAWPGGALEARQPEFPGSECITRTMTTVAQDVAPPGRAEILEAGPGRLTVQAEGPGWLATRQPWYPGWIGRIDGAEASVEIVNGALVGMELPEGIHVVTLSYWPAGLTVGLAVSALAALIMLAAWWADRLIRRRRSVRGKLHGPTSALLFSEHPTRASTQEPLPETSVAMRPISAMSDADDDVWDRLGSLAQRLAPESIEQRLLYLLLLVALLLRLLWLGVPDGALIFDEKYYVNAARVLASIEPQQAMYPDGPLGLDPNSEHPPLAKVITAVSIRLLGDNAYGWRVPSALFGTLAIFLVFRIGRRISGDPRVGLVAAALLAFDNLAFVHSRIFTLDISMLALLLLGIDQYLRGRPGIAGVGLALSALCKLPGSLGLLILFSYEVLLLMSSGSGRGQLWPAMTRMTRLAGGFALGFLALLTLLDLLFTQFPQPFAHLQHMTEYARLLRRQAPSGTESLPWQWLWNDVEVPYLRVDQQVRAGDEILESRPIVWFRGAMNPFVLTVWPVALSFAAYCVWKRRPGSETAALTLAWFAASLLPFMAASLIWQRISYIFYFLPVLPSIVIAAGACFLAPGVPRLILCGYLLAVLIGFYGFFPYR